MKNYYNTKTKAQRQQWWDNLTPDKKETQIIKWQRQKAKKRKLYSEKKLKFNPKYPWMTTGVNDKNRKKWLAMIRKKNPWLKVA